MTQTKPAPVEEPVCLSIVSKALGEFHTARTAREAENKSALDRGDELLQRILGADAKYAFLLEDYEGVLFELDNMELLFFEGATPEDDYFEIALFGMPVPRAVRSLAGLGQALDEIIDRVRYLAEIVNTGTPE